MKTIKKIKEFFHTTYESEPLRVPPKTWFYTFMCMNIPFYGWRYLKQLVYQEPNDSPKSQFARAYLYYKRVFLRISLAIAALLAVIGFAGLHLLIRYMEML